MGIGCDDCFICHFLDLISCENITRHRETCNICLLCLDKHETGVHDIRQYLLQQEDEKWDIEYADCSVCDREDVLALKVPICEE